MIYICINCVYSMPFDGSGGSSTTLFRGSHHLRIKALNDVSRGYYTGHGYYHTGDSGYDLFVLEDIEFPPHSQRIIKFGIAAEFIKHNIGSSFMLIPRSSISKTPLRMSNNIGLIDAGYRGEMMAYCDNIYDKPYKVEKGTRLFQLINSDLVPFTVELVDELSGSTRGDGGFGSTSTPSTSV